MGTDAKNRRQAANEISWRRILLCAALFALAALSCAPRVTAQVSAEISGTVTDSSGGAVAGVAVTAKNVDTGATRDNHHRRGGPLSDSCVAPGRLRSARIEVRLCG